MVSSSGRARLSSTRRWARFSLTQSLFISLDWICPDKQLFLPCRGCVAARALRGCIEPFPRSAGPYVLGRRQAASATATASKAPPERKDLAEFPSASLRMNGDPAAQGRSVGRAYPCAPRRPIHPGGPMAGTAGQETRSCPTIRMGTAGGYVRLRRNMPALQNGNGRRGAETPPYNGRRHAPSPRDWM